MRRIASLAALLSLAPLPAAAQAEVDLGPPFGTLRLVDEVVCGDPEDPHPFREDPAGASRIESVLGRSARVMESTGGSRYFAYRVGADAELVAGRAYVLDVEYPEDAPRTMFIANRGAEQIRGLSTGAAIGDARGGYTNNGLESIDYPLSGGWESHRTLFYLHERFAGIELQRGPDPRPDTPDDGFWVILAQLAADDAPLSAGAACARIRLFEVPDPEALYASIAYPPEPLPRRFIFWREEMSDNAIGTRNGNVPVTAEAVTWHEHRARLMRFLGVNTYSKDLLEFGANQGWDSSRYGGNSWVHQSAYPMLWSQIIDMLAEHGHYVLPYYEYTGSKGDSGLGFQRRAEPLSRPRYQTVDPPRCGGYTHITWSEVANVDVTDPDVFEDFRRMLEITIVDHRDQVSFVGAWVRNRVSDMPISFSDATRARFAEEVNDGVAVSRDELRNDEGLYARYVSWFHERRAAFFAQVREYLREALGDDAALLYTPFHEEAGPAVQGGIVADDPSRFDGTGVSAQSFDEYVGGAGWLESVMTPHVNWTDGACSTPYEWHHANPPPELERYHAAQGVLTTFPFHRLFTTARPDDAEAFRTPSGLAAVRHYTLNEDRIQGQIGYFVSDVDRAGPYSMLAEARLLAHGDPRYLGYLVSHSFNRGFPEYARAFNLAFLALPAVPSEVVPGAASEDEVVVRVYPTEAHGTFVAVIHTGLRPLEGVRVTLPVEGAVQDRVSGAAVPTEGRVLTLDLRPAEVRALHIDATSPPLPQGDGGAIHGDGGVPSVGDAGPSAAPSSGCGCRSAGGGEGAPAGWLALALAVVGWRRFRRATSRRA